MIDTITARDLMALEIEPPKQVIQGVFTAGLNILAGNPKAGKSFLSLGLSLAVANGGLAFNKIRVNKAPVLYLALEDNNFRLKSRLKMLNQPTPETLHFGTYLPKLGEGGMEAIHAYLTQNPNTEMVVIDTLARVSDAKTGTDVYGEDAAIGSALQALAMTHQIALVVVHHTRKASHGDFLHMVSGSAGFTGAADTVLVMTRQRNETAATLEITGRDIRESKMNLTWYSPNGGWLAQGHERPEHAVTRRRDLA